MTQETRNVDYESMVEK